MIYVNKEQFQQVEYLIEQSILGNHLLFDLETLRSIYWTELSLQDAYAVEPHIERIVQLPTLRQKRDYIESLDPSTREGVIKTYFSIIENNLSERSEVRH